jgi:UDPglucose--hexose-1-phosphate uridylyltransferase
VTGNISLQTFRSFVKYFPGTFLVCTNFPKGFPMLDTPHRRYNSLTGEWVLVSPHRAKRPWLGQVEKLSPETLPAYDPTCYLCPRNERAGGMFNPDYAGTYSFENDFAALLPDSVDEEPASAHPLLVSVPERGQIGRAHV